MALEETQVSNTLVSVLLNMLPVIIGGLLTAVGGFMASVILHRLSKKTSRINLKREKLEQLIRAVYAMKNWLEEKENMDLFDKTKDLGESPMSDIKTISNLYIPELKKEVNKFSMAVIDYRKWILDGRKKKLSNQLTSEYTKTLEPIYSNLLVTMLALTNKASDIMKEINKS